MVKGISWRVVATLDTFILALIIFGDLNKAMPIAGAEIVTKVFLYYFHERIWNQVKWGRVNGHVSHIRSVVKGISYRFFGSLDTMLLSLLFTGNVVGAFAMGVSEVLTKVVLFYFHERLWASVRWGRVFILPEKN
ncbi:MAG: DUF2061 domain-containing protein [Bacteroidota bacterium]